MDRRQPLEKEKVESERNKLYEISEKQENRVRHLETSMMQLVFAYVFFQGVIFFSIFHHPNVSCDYWWIPFSLSCLIFVIFAIPFKSFIRNWERTKYYHEMNFLQQDLLHQTIMIFSSVETNMYDHPQKPQFLQSLVQSPSQSPTQLQVSQSPMLSNPPVQSEQPVVSEPPVLSEPSVQPVESQEIMKSSQSPSQLQVSQSPVLSEPPVLSESPVQSQEILKSDTARVYRRNAFIYLVSLALVAYTILILKACRSIPCHRDATP